MSKIAISQIILTVLKKPSVILPMKHIYLLSHMRANTSLIGHILGENDDIRGYYELHIGYYSWKSLVRQKLIYFSEHPNESTKPYIFDKILHNEHPVTDQILNKCNTCYMICLRKPEITVKSAVSMFRDRDPNHEFARIENVVQYYHARLDKLLVYATKLKGKYLYYDAESLIEKPEQTLFRVRNFLQLSSPLKTTFNTKKLTGKGSSGDNTGNLKEGKIIKTASKYADVVLSHKDIDALNKKYSSTREILKRLSY